ncbi:MAG: permease [Candidatus Methanomethylophilaceae archaeon]|jgi:uncharacterized membrane protein YraQ (UPF0718 family)
MIEQVSTTLYFFLYILLELTVLFLVISFLVGLLREYVAPERIKAAMTRRNKAASAALGAGFGALTPFCSCSTIPLLKGMIDSGVPFGSSMAFLVASPLLNPIIVGMLLTILPVPMVLLYFITIFIGAVLVGITMERMGLEKDVKDVVIIGGPQDDDNGGLDTSSKARFQRAASFSWGLFQQMFKYLLIGVAIGAFIYGFVPEDLIASIAGPGNPLAIPFAALIGIPLYVRAETLIPIGTALLSKGMGVGPVIALLIGGAGASIPEVIMLGALFEKRTVAVYVMVVIAVAILAGLMFATTEAL